MNGSKENPTNKTEIKDLHETCSCPTSCDSGASSNIGMSRPLGLVTIVGIIGPPRARWARDPVGRERRIWDVVMPAVVVLLVNRPSVGASRRHHHRPALFIFLFMFFHRIIFDEVVYGWGGPFKGPSHQLKACFINNMAMYKTRDREEKWKELEKEWRSRRRRHCLERERERERE